METALKADKLLLVAHGAASEMVRAREILMYAGAVEVITHNYRNFATSLAA
jgi:hypothetical protein